MSIKKKKKIKESDWMKERDTHKKKEKEKKCHFILIIYPKKKYFCSQVKK